MSNNNIFNNTTSLQEVLEILQNKAAGGGGGGVDTSDATAVAADIMLGETAYVADGKVTGTFTLQEELAAQNNLISQIITLVESKANPSGGGGGGNIETCTVVVEVDASSSILGVRMDGNLPVPIYIEDTLTSQTWTIPCGSIVAIAYPYSYIYILQNATYLGTDANGTYATNFLMGFQNQILLFRIDAQAGQTATIALYER